MVLKYNAEQNKLISWTHVISRETNIEQKDL